MPRFSIEYKNEIIDTVDLYNTPITVGRLPESTLCIPSMGISRKHCIVDRNLEGNFVITDNGSLNGTLLNGVKINTSTLQHGDKITIGRHILYFEILPGDTAESEAQASEQNEHKTVAAVLIETNKHLVYKLDKSYLTLGNGEKDDIFVSGFMVSELQAVIEKRDDKYCITTNKFSSRLKVNGQKTKSHILSHKDRIEIGNAVFRYMEKE